MANETQRRNPLPGPMLRQRGFTLIELLVALTVTVIGLVGLMSLHLSTMKANNLAARTQEANVAAHDAIEELRAMTLDAITTKYGPLPITDEPMGTVDGRAGMVYTRTLDVTRLSNKLHKIRVEILWADDGSDPATADDRFKHTVVLEFLRTSVEAP